MALSDNIKRLRTERGMTLEELASQCGVAFQQIQKYERNTMKPQPEVFVSIAQALGTTCEELVNGKEG